MSPESVKDERKTKQQLIQELAELRRRLDDSDAGSSQKDLRRANEDRKRAEIELSRTKEYLENVIENSADAIGIVDRRGKFILWNRRAAQIYGYDLDELAGKAAFELYQNASELDRMLKRLRKNELVREFEILMKKRDGSVVPMDISISLLKDEEGKTIGSVCVARDLSERKRSETALKAARDELSRYSKNLEAQVKTRTREITGILKYTPSVVYIKDTDGRYSLVNSRFEELLGIGGQDVFGKTDHDLFPAEIADRMRAADIEILSTRRSSQVEEAVPREDGVHTYLTVKFPLYDEQGEATGVSGIATDITELKKVQDKLRLLSASIMDGQEKERTAIARELHDELGQVLTALRMDSAWLLKRLKEVDPAASERAQAMCSLVDKTIDDVRNIALRLRPGVLDDLGLIAALEWFAADFEKRTEIVCFFRHINVQKVDNIVATAVYRIVQEALTNVARHASATRVDVAIMRKGRRLILTVADNGIGFEVGGIDESRALGIAGMRERANLAGGSLDITSRPGKGARMQCKLPV